VDAAKYLAALLHAMPDDAALAMWTGGCERVDRAFEAVEDVALATSDHLEGLVVFVFANFTFSHGNSLSRAAGETAVARMIGGSESRSRTHQRDRGTVRRNV
jgi:hypothetical protein